MENTKVFNGRKVLGHRDLKISFLDDMVRNLQGVFCIIETDAVISDCFIRILDRLDEMSPEPDVFDDIDDMLVVYLGKEVEVSNGRK